MDGTKRKRSAAAGVVSALFLAVTLAGTATPAVAADGDPFDVTDPQIFIAQGSEINDPTHLHQVQTAGDGSYDLGPGEAPNPSTAAYNAIGFNVVDRFLYGMVAGTESEFPSGSIVRVGEGNTVTRVGSTTYTHPGATGTDSRWVLGAFNPIDGKYYATGVSERDFLVVDINAWSAAGGLGDPSHSFVNVKDESGAPTQLPLVHDFAVGVDGFAYSVVRGGESIAQIDLRPTSPQYGTLRTFPTSSFVGGNPFTEVDSPSSPAIYGALWYFGNGNLGIASNQSGKIYQVEIGGTPDEPTFRLISALPGDQARENDGASIRGSDVDLSVTKTADTSTYEIGDVISYSLTVKNENATVGTSSGWKLTDTLPAGLVVVGVREPATGASNAPTCSVSGSTITCVGGRLAPQESVTVIFDARAEAAPGTSDECYNNVADVLGNERDPVVSNNSDNAVTCPVSDEPALVVTKSADPEDTSTVVPGDTVTYTVRFENTGSGVATVDHDDALGGVLDDASFVAGSLQVTPTTPGFTAVYLDGGTTDPSDDRLAFDGTVAADSPRTASYSVTVLPDRERGDNELRNVVFPGGSTPPTGPCAADDPLCTTHPVPSLSLDKQVSRVVDIDDNGFTDTGDHIFYVFDVTNTGRTVLTDVRVDDPLLTAKDIGVACEAATLQPEESTRCTANEPYVITAADVDNGKVDNVATSTGTPPGEPPVTSPPDETETPTDDPPADVPPTTPGKLASTGAESPMAAVGAAGIAVLLGAALLTVVKYRRGRIGN